MNYKEIIKGKLSRAAGFFITFMRWTLISAVIGIICGFFGAAFHLSIDLVTEIRMEHSWLIYLLPIGGIIIAFLYRQSHMRRHKGTDNIIESVRGHERVPLRTAPLIFIATVITHLCGGSAGREGAALQLGGSIGFKTAELLKLDEKDRTLVVMCGMSAFFSALFGTPLTAALFSIEVTSVGIMYYAGLIPCTVSALTAYSVTHLIGIESTAYKFIAAPEFNLYSVMSVAVIAILCAAISVIFCMMLHGSSALMKKAFKNEYKRILVGSALVIALTLICGTNDYNGAGTHVINAAAHGEAVPWAFALKMIFTAITISAGFKGGEIVPTFFVGATFGCFMAGLIGLDSGFGAAVGMIAMFCGMLNCPVASIILSIEMFGDEGIMLFAIASGISYMLSGYYGLYHSQKIMYSKTKAEFINADAK